MANSSIILRRSLQQSLAATSTSAPLPRLGGPIPFRIVTSLRSQQNKNISVRAQSTWGGITNGEGPRRPIVNGQSVAFHVKDLKNLPRHNNSSRQAVNGNGSERKQYESDLVVILDMDECLIHSQFLDGPGAKFAHQVRRGNTHGWSAPSIKHDPVETFKISLPDGELVLVNERPYLREFLETISTKYETHIFTAAMEVYAKPVLDVLDPQGVIFSKVWYRESCVLDREMGAYVKNLDFEWGGDQLKRTVLVDNNPLSFLSHPSNGILVSSFYDDPRDETLPAVLDLLEELDEETDVRPVLESRFGLEQALEDLQAGGQSEALRQSSSLAAAPNPA